MVEQNETVVGSALRRMILVLAVAVLMVVMMVTTAVPAFAAASLKADQVGKQTSGVNQSDPGFGGYITSGAARANGGMDFVARYQHH